MQTLTIAWEAALHLARLIWESASYVSALLSTCCKSRCKLAAEIVALRSQVAACRDRVGRKRVPKPRFTTAFRVLWVVLSRLLTGWEDVAQVVKPATAKRWHNQGYRLWWRWKSRKRGRSSLAQGVRALIRKLSRENGLWSAERIRDTLLLLGYPPIRDDTVRKYMVKPRKPSQPSTTWLPLLRNHLGVTGAIDFFTVTTMSFATLDVFLVFEHGRRTVIQLATTRHATMEWVGLTRGDESRFCVRTWGLDGEQRGARR